MTAWGWLQQASHELRNQVSLGCKIAYADVVDSVRRQGASNYGMWNRLRARILDLAGGG